MKRGILRRIRTLLFLTVIAASFSYRTSHAQDCNPLMPQAPVNSEVSNQIKANANILTKKLGSVEIDNQFKKVQEDVQSKYPHADTLSIWKSLIYLDCTLLQNSNLPPEEKQKQFLLLMDKFKQSPPPATAPATPRNMGRRERPQVINISGYVYNAKNEDPIPNLRVEVYNGGDAWTNHAGYFAIELGPPFKVGSYFHLEVPGWVIDSPKHGDSTVPAPGTLPFKLYVGHHGDQVTLTEWLYVKPVECKLAPGTVITMQNWIQYKDCFSVGVQHFFLGDLFWKMPDDVEIHVGAPHQWTLPKPYVVATEKYGEQTRLVKQPNGLYKLDNYVAGLPFPNPSEPDKGTKIAANVTYKMQGYQWGMFQDMGAAPVLFTKDRFGNSSPSILDFTYIQTAYNWEGDQGVPPVNPQAAGSWYTQWIMQQTPEQSKYTTVLTIFWQDNLRDEDDYVFVPALRRSLRLSASARCAPLFGSDAIKDDQRYGWNGGVGKFMGKWLRDMKLLTLAAMDPKLPASLANWDGMLGWSKPSWGDWETRDVYVVDIRRSPEFAPGYCYGSRVDYIDKQYYTSLAEDIYDGQLQLWKIYVINSAPKAIDNYGEQMWMGGIASAVWDVQNDHATYATTANPNGLKIFWDKEIPERYRDVARYGTPEGLSQLMH